MCLEEQGEKNPMVKVCVKNETPKGACVLEKEIRDQQELEIASIWFGNNGQLEYSEIHGLGWLWGLLSSWFL